MKNIKTLTYALSTLLFSLICVTSVYADVISPGEYPGGHGRRVIHYPLTDDEFIAYVISGVVVTVIVVLSLVVLYKLKKNK
jgi:hypothetical protein